MYGSPLASSSSNLICSLLVLFMWSSVSGECIPIPNLLSNQEEPAPYILAEWVPSLFKMSIKPCPLLESVNWIIFVARVPADWITITSLFTAADLIWNWLPGSIPPNPSLPVLVNLAISVAESVSPPVLINKSSEPPLLFMFKFKSFSAAINPAAANWMSGPLATEFVSNKVIADPIFMSPLTSNLTVGSVVPIPTLPPVSKNVWSAVEA